MDLFKIRLLLIMTAITLSNLCLYAQVTIGGLKDPKLGAILDLNSDTKGGLVLSSVSIDDLGKIPGGYKLAGISAEQDQNSELIGTIVYNTNVSTGVGIYVWDGEDWNKIAANLLLTIKGDPSNTEPAPSNGSKENKYQVTDASCKESGDYTFTWVTGANFIDQLTLTSADEGKFTVKFLPNNRATERRAVLLVTSPCGNNNTFVFAQEGDPSGCGKTASIPAIKAANTTDLCTSGAVYLYLDGTPSSGTYIWTLNDEEVAIGTSCVVNKPGKYIVYADKLGCATPVAKNVIVKSVSKIAPAPVQIIASNNGVFCSGAEAKLSVNAQQGGIVHWFRDGTHQQSTGNPITTKQEGAWQAMISNNGCSSLPSDKVNLIEDKASATKAPTRILINGNSNYDLCQGGSAYLSAEGTISPTLSYTWYADNTLIGSGPAIYYPVPSGVNNILLRLQVTQAGSCASEISIQKDINKVAPVAPVITSNGALCGGSSSLGILTSASGNFKWYKNDEFFKDALASVKTLTVDQPGNYSVTVSEGTCTSLRSADKTIALSDFTTLSWVQRPPEASYSDIKVLEVSATNGPVVYTWKVTQDNGNDITNNNLTIGQGSNLVQVQLPNKNTNAKYVVVEVRGNNACGIDVTQPLLKDTITLTGACPTPIVTIPAEDVTYTIQAGASIKLDVVAANLNAPSYQWMYSDGGSFKEVQGATQSSYIASANSDQTKIYFCKVTNGCGSTDVSKKFTLKFIKPGQGNLGYISGKTCFDVAQTGSCEPLTGRATANFSNTADITYKFVATGSGSDLDFMIDDPEGCLKSDKPYDKLYTASSSFSSGQTFEIRLNFAKDNSYFAGRTRETAAMITIYALYKSGGALYSNSLNIRIQDCTCCGAILDGQWKLFMCYNLGVTEANQTDPFNPRKDIRGKYYQWGQNKPAGDYSSSAISGWNKTYPDSQAWRDDVKTANDPCPPGWRVPTKKQWLGLGAPTKVGTWGASENRAGIKFGSSLMLPAVGCLAKEDGTGGYVGETAFYWSSTIDVNPNFSHVAQQFISLGAGNNTNGSLMTEATPIRCIEDQ